MYRERLNGEALAAFATTARQNGLAVLGAHTDQESVGPLATPIVRLKRTL
jgi:hypothetical protein